jgi:2'-hydroxyisoflavone reductase
MPLPRRSFLLATAAGVVAACSPAMNPTPSAKGPVATASSGRKKTILILGGTGFLGPALVDAARAKGHTLTLFNRGKTNPQLFPDIEKLHGDRNKDMAVLAGRSWDAVIDTSGYSPAQITKATDVLAGKVGQYVFISTISVYSPTKNPIDEQSAVGKLEDPTADKVNENTYGPLKALSEAAAEHAMPGKVTNIRPGLIVGPRDATDRFTYWPVRVSRGGDVLAPGTPADPIQYVDVRDLAEWSIRCVEEQTTGVFNAVGPASTLGIGALLDACKSVSGSDARFVWAAADFLAKEKVEAWSDMPVWVPPSGDESGMTRVSSARAIAKGLTFRAVNDTVKDTLAWWKTLPDDRTKKLRAGLSPEREAEVLKALATSTQPASAK